MILRMGYCILGCRLVCRENGLIIGYGLFGARFWIWWIRARMTCLWVSKLAECFYIINILISKIIVLYTFLLF